MNDENKQKNKIIRQQKRDFTAKANKLFSKQFRTSLRYEESLLMEDGKVHINVDLTKVESPFSIYSYDKRMDPEIYGYIEDQVFYIRADIPVSINFDDGGKYDVDLKEKIKKCVIRHYTLEYEDKKMEYMRGIVWGIMFTIVGVLILALYIVLGATILQGYTQFIEIFVILSWFFVWQGADLFFFTGRQRRMEINNAAQLALADITFNKVK